MIDEQEGSSSRCLSGHLGGANELARTAGGRSGRARQSSPPRPTADAVFAGRQLGEIA
ncbi:MAG: hypothetical protein ACLR4Z_03315 [Butyricicoccaceae bacterium]